MCIKQSELELIKRGIEKSVNIVVNKVMYKHKTKDKRHIMTLHKKSLFPLHELSLSLETHALVTTISLSHFSPHQNCVSVRQTQAHQPQVVQESPQQRTLWQSLKPWQPLE